MKSSVESRMFTFAVNDMFFYVLCDYPFCTDKRDNDTSLHTHFMYELHFMYSGEETLTVINQRTKSEKKYFLDAGDLMFIPKNIYHNASTKRGGIRLSIKFEVQYNPNTEFTHRYNFFYNIKNILEKIDKPHIIKNNIIKLLFEELRDRYNSTDDSNSLKYAYHKQLIVSSVLNEIVKELMRDNKLESTDVKQEIICADRKYIIKDFISARYSTENALNDLSKTLCLSVRQTQNLTKHYMGKNFISLVLEQKMTNARLLIENTKKSLKQVSEDVGFHSYSSFYTYYRKYYGCTPAEHRKMV